MALRSAPRASKLGNSRRWFLLFAFVISVTAGCNRESAQLSALREENERLKRALEQARSSAPPLQAVDGGLAPKADLDLSIAELWSQRFEDTPFRAKQRLDQKLIRVTALVESVSDRNVTLSGTGTRFGSVNLLIQLDDAYIKQILDGLASLQKGAQVTVQGRFLFEKMWLDSAVFVDRKTGKLLLSKDLVDMPRPDASAESSREKP